MDHLSPKVLENSIVLICFCSFKGNKVVLLDTNIFLKKLTGQHRELRDLALWSLCCVH